MKKYEVSYKMRDPRYPKQMVYLWKWSTETIEARGIVHASNLAKSHKADLQKVATNKLEIQWIREIQDER